MKTADFIDTLTERLEPITPLSSPGRRAGGFLLLSSAWLMVGIFVVGVHRGPLDRFQSLTFLFECGAALVMIVLGSLVAFRLSVPGESQQRRSTRLLEFVALVWLLFLTGRLALEYFELGSAALRTPVWPTCPLLVGGFAAVPTIVLLNLLRRGRVMGRLRAGLVLGIVAAMIGAIAARFICPSEDVAHLFFWHLMPTVGCAGAGLAIAVLLLRAPGDRDQG